MLVGHVREYRRCPRKFMTIITRREHIEIIVTTHGRDHMRTDKRFVSILRYCSSCVSRVYCTLYALESKFGFSGRQCVISVRCIIGFTRWATDNNTRRAKVKRWKRKSDDGIYEDGRVILRFGCTYLRYSQEQWTLFTTGRFRPSESAASFCRDRRRRMIRLYF